jgi:putative flippase GtrA
MVDAELTFDRPPAAERTAGVADAAPAGRRALRPRLTPGLRRLIDEGWKYFVVSFAALALDWGLLVSLTAWAHVHYLVSAAVGFGAGLLVNYALSVAWVFRERRLTKRWKEFAGFLMVGLAGLALNEGLMKLFVETAGLGYAIAKIPATGIGFIFNFGLRRALLFTKAPAAGASADLPP